MLLKPLSEEMQIELVVSKASNAMLLHKGPLPHEYLWAQYDQNTQSFQFVTEDGGLQDLGLIVHEPFQAPLMNARELMTVEVLADASLGRPRLIKFSALAE